MAYLPESLKLSSHEVQQQIEDYKHLHSNPELSHQEYQTADFIERRFNELELGEGVTREVWRIGETGVVLSLSRGEGPVVAFRADIDGLPLKEEVDRSYASQATGTLDGNEVPLMHGCGHDTHITSALYAAQLWAADPGNWQGTALFIMQPAEEVADGAQTMVDAGLWEQVPHPEIIFGQHVWPDRSGHFIVSAGELMTAADSMRVTVLGSGAHGSQPENSIDPIVLGAAMITRLQTIVSREVAPLEAAVVTVGMFQGGFKENIIPESAVFTLNVRTFNPEVREKVLNAIHRIIKGEAMVAGAPEPKIEHLSGFPPTTNDEQETAALQQAFIQQFGQDAVATDPAMKAMGSEDFSDLATALGVPYVFWFFGGYNEHRFTSGETIYSNHSPYFSPDPEVTLEQGTYAALTALYSKLGTSQSER